MPKPSIKQHKDIIRCNNDIKEYVQLRMAELGLSVADLCTEAEKYKVKLNKFSYSKWINSDGYTEGTPTQFQILWICHRLGITLKLEIEKEENYNWELAAPETQSFINNYREL